VFMSVCLADCLCVFQKSEFCRNAWTVLAGFGMEVGDLRHTSTCHIIKKIRVPPKIRLVPSGTLSQTTDFATQISPRHIDRRNVLSTLFDKGVR